LTLTVHNVTTARDFVRRCATRRETRLQAADVSHIGTSRVNNIRALQRLNAGQGITNLPPQGRATEYAAYSRDLRSMHHADLAAHELRVWDGDPGD
jgi:hypothetical protein